MGAARERRTQLLLRPRALAGARRHLLGGRVPRPERYRGGLRHRRDVASRRRVRRVPRARGGRWQRAEILGARRRGGRGGRVGPARPLRTRARRRRRRRSNGSGWRGPTTRTWRPRATTTTRTTTTTTTTRRARRRRRRRGRRAPTATSSTTPAAADPLSSLWSRGCELVDAVAGGTGDALPRPPPSGGEAPSACGLCEKEFRFYRRRHRCRRCNGRFCDACSPHRVPPRRRLAHKRARAAEGARLFRVLRCSAARRVAAHDATQRWRDGASCSSGQAALPCERSRQRRRCRTRAWVSLVHEQPALEKYNSMLRMRVPRSAVAHKMVLDGVAGDAIDCFTAGDAAARAATSRPSATETKIDDERPQTPAARDDRRCAARTLMPWTRARPRGRCLRAGRRPTRPAARRRPTAGSSATSASGSSSSSPSTRPPRRACEQA